MSKHKYNIVENYLIVKCIPLNDPWECDADRIPICITNDYSNYNEEEYEVYGIYTDGRLKIVRKCTSFPY